MTKNTDFEYLEDGTSYIIGKNARHNDFITFSIGKAEDTWLHIKGLPGPHCIIRFGENLTNDIKNDNIMRIATLLVEKSLKHTNKKTVLVDMCKCIDITKPRGCIPGQVHISNSSIVKIKLN